MNARIASRLTAILISLGSASVAIAQDAQEFSNPEAPGSARPGFYASLNFGDAAFDLDDQVEARFADLEINLGQVSKGGGLAIGYSWSNQFSLELQLDGGSVDTSNDKIDAAFGQISLAVRAPLMTRSRVAPYLEGHLGGTALVFDGSAIDDRAFVGGHTGLGGGVEVHVGRRWALDFGYRFSIVDFEQEQLTTALGDREISLEGSGRVHRWMVRTVFSF